MLVFRLRDRNLFRILVLLKVYEIHYGASCTRIIPLEVNFSAAQ